MDKMCPNLCEIIYKEKTMITTKKKKEKKTILYKT